MNPSVKTPKSELLAQLSLNRDGTTAPYRRSSVRSVWIVLLALSLGGIGIWIYASSNDNIPETEQVTVPSDSALKSSSRALGEQSMMQSDNTVAALLQATGYVVARQSATVSARTTAAVHKVYVEEGSFVQAGAVMAQLDDKVKRAQYELAESELETATSRVAEVNAGLHAAQLRLTRAMTMTHKNMASQAELDAAVTEVDQSQARLATTQKMVSTATRKVDVQRLELEDYVIRAPFAGVVTRRSAQRGEIVSPISAGGGYTRTGIATLVNMASLEVEVDVTEAYISRVQPDQPVRIVLNAYPDTHYEGRVIAVIPTADRNKATVRVRIALLDPDTRVFPEMGVRVDFLSA